MLLLLWAAFELPIDQSYADKKQQKVFISQRPFEWVKQEKRK